MYNFNND